MIGLCICIGVSIAQAAQMKTAQTVNKSEVKQQPSHSAKTVTTLAKDAKVTVEKRQRAWYQITTSKGVQGWIKMLQLRFASAAAQASSGSLWNSLTTQNASTTASTGIRGFNEQDLQQASPDMQAVKKLARFQASDKQVKAFAKQGKLKANARK